MASLAVYSTKGGVGKSTIAASLAWYAASASGHQTLLWDLDPNGGATFLYGIEPGKRAKVEQVFADETALDGRVWSSGYERLHVLPADASLRALDTTLLKLGKKRRLAALIARLGRDYARIVLDCPPVLNELSAQVMRSVDAVIVPLTPSQLSVRALEQVRADLAANHKRHPPLLPVLSMIDRRRASHCAALAEHPDWPVIPMAAAVEQMAALQRPLGAFAPASPAAQAFSRLWAGIDQRLRQSSTT